MKKIFRVLVILLILAGFGTAGYLGLQLSREKDRAAGVSQQLEKLQARNTGLRRKYMEQKAISDGLSRRRQAAEAKVRGAEEKIQSLDDDNKKLLATLKKQDQDFKKTRQGMEVKITDLIAEREKCAGTVKKGRQDIAALKKTIDARQADIKNLEQEKTEALAKLSSTSSRLSICAGNNLKLRDIANELAELYKNKGVVGAIFDDEKLIQYRQVEIEKLLQEYDERIDKLQFSLH